MDHEVTSTAQSGRDIENRKKEIMQSGRPGNTVLQYPTFQDD
jgi:hypothetical protein